MTFTEPPVLALLACCATLAILALSARAPESGPEEVRIEPSQRRQTFEGWGASLCWWANAVGGWDDEAKKVELLDLVFDPDKGLGLNIVRYNIGGGENPDHDFMWPWRAVPGFRPAPDAPYDWTADANQRWVLLESIKRGVTITEAFANSPPWWMTISGSVTGSRKGHPGTCNLRDDMCGAFADYLTDVVREYRGRYGVTFDTLSPFNEPTAGWWTLGNNQEGCCIPVDQQHALLDKMAEHLSGKGLTTKLSAPEESSIDHTIESFSSYGAATQQAIYQINTHTYAGEGRAALRDLAREAGKRLYVSEYGNGIDGEFGSALELVRVISVDLNQLQCLGWVYWQPVGNMDNPTDWHAIDVSYSRRDEIVIKKQYWAYLHFTRHIRPGAIILSTSVSDVVAALTPAGELVLVVSNRGPAERPLVFDVSAFAGAAEQASWRSTTEGEDYASRPAVRVRDGSLAISVPPRSVNTLVLAGAAAGARRG